MTQLVLRWRDRELISRVRDMGEDLWRELQPWRSGALSIEEVDAATDHFSIKVSRTDIGPAVVMVRRKLKKHNLESDVRIERD